MLEIFYITYVKMYPPLVNENVFKIPGYSHKTRTEEEVLGKKKRERL